MKPPAPLEREVKRAVLDFYAQVGVRVWNLDQGFRPGGKRHGTTRQSKGIADLYCTWSHGYAAWWVELKRPGGKQSPEQAEFQRSVEACGVGYVLGGVREVVAHYRGLRLLGNGSLAAPQAGASVPTGAETPPPPPEPPSGR